MAKKKKKTAKEILMQRLKETGRIRRLSFDHFAYYDEKVGRWRAGKYCTTRKQGTFLSAAHAQRIRASVSISVRASEQAVRIAKQRRGEITNEQALIMAYQFVRDYNKTARVFERERIPNARERAWEYVNERYGLYGS